MSFVWKTIFVHTVGVYTTLSKGRILIKNRKNNPQMRRKKNRSPVFGDLLLGISAIYVLRFWKRLSSARELLCRLKCVGLLNHTSTLHKSPSQVFCFRDITSQLIIVIVWSRNRTQTPHTNSGKNPENPSVFIPSPWPAGSRNIYFQIVVHISQDTHLDFRHSSVMRSTYRCDSQLGMCLT